MNKIIQLPPEIINQIAAGEVIENPASVVKELIENSLDAGADEIFISIKNYGFEKIIVKDNGIGILKEDLLKAPLKHATSKIKEFNDLYSIKSYGFRGEALATIFAVAETELISRTENSEVAYKITSENLNRIVETAGKKGTSVIVKNLFYNVPARKKYLKSGPSELREIIITIQKFALINPNVRFVFKHNNKELLNKPKFSNLIDNSIFILGRELKDKIIELRKTEQTDKNSKNKNIQNLLKIEGFIGDPTKISYRYKKNQFIYVNSRPVKSKLICDAIKDGMEERLMIGREPLFLINLIIDPEIIDVNIHPRKLEIKFENESLIYEQIRSTIANILTNEELIITELSNLTAFKTKTDISSQKRLFNNSETINLKKPQKNKFSKNYFSEISQERLEKFYKEAKIDFDKNEILNNLNKNYQKPIKETTISDKNKKTSAQNKNPLIRILDKYRIIGVLNKTYILVETAEGLILIDFHAAEEKIRFEELIKNYDSNKNFKKQKLLKPKIINLTIDEIALYKEFKEEIKKLGFDIEIFGGNSVVVREVPLDFKNEPIEPEIIKELLNRNELAKIKKDKKELKNFFARKACRASRKAGYDISNKEITILIEKMKKIEKPLNCPHGRPTLIKLSWKEIEKLFKRIV